MTTLTQPTNTFSRTAVIALLLGASAIAFSPIFVRLSEAGPISTAFWRVTLAVPFLWIGVAIAQSRSKDEIRPLTKQDYKILVTAGTFFAANLTVWHLALNYTSMANATVLPNLAPVFVTLGAWLFLHQRVTRTFLVGLLLALVGVTILIGQSFSLNTENLLGDMLALSTAVFYAGYLLSIKQARAHVATLKVMAWSGSVCALILLPVALLSGEPFFATSWQGWAVLFGLALFSHASGQGLIAYALAALPATFSSVSLLWQPVMSNLLAWAILGIALSGWQIIGGLIVLCGIFIARRGSLNN